MPKRKNKKQKPKIRTRPTILETLIGVSSIFLIASGVAFAYNIKDGDDFFKAKNNFGVVYKLNNEIQTAENKLEEEFVIPLTKINNPSYIDSIRTEYNNQMQELDSLKQAYKQKGGDKTYEKAKEFSDKTISNLWRSMLSFTVSAILLSVSLIFYSDKTKK